MLIMIGPERDKGNEARKAKMFHSERFTPQPYKEV